MTWYVYILVTTDLKFSYCGATKDFRHRFRQHCGEIAGGAVYTTSMVKAGYTWRPFVVISGFPHQREALQMELCQKQKMDKYRNANLTTAAKAAIGSISFKHARLKKLSQALLLKKWTTNAIESVHVNLSLYWHNIQDMPIGWATIMPPHLKEHCSYDWSAFEQRSLIECIV